MLPFPLSRPFPGTQFDTIAVPAGDCKPLGLTEKYFLKAQSVFNKMSYTAEREKYALTNVLTVLSKLEKY